VLAGEFRLQANFVFSTARSQPMKVPMLWVMLLLVLANLIVAIPVVDAARRERRDNRR
jgi:hypothetical protein